MTFPRFTSAICVLAICASITSDSYAQNDTWSLEIANGKVTLNGAALQQGSYPAALAAEELVYYLDLPAYEKPILAIGDGVYLIQEKSIREATPDEIEKNGIIAVFAFSRDDARTVVQNSLREIERSASLVPSEQVQENMRGNAMRASQMVAALPHLEMQSYWNDVRENDDALYRALKKERLVEADVIGLVDTIRKLPDGEPRDKAISELRNQLISLFDMKQENRRGEIRELEQQLETLTDRMIQREKMKLKIVDHRMKELLGDAYR